MPNKQSQRICQSIPALFQEWRGELASSVKKSQCQSQVHKLFAGQLVASLGSSAYQRLITSFMTGNHRPLADALCEYQKNQSLAEISKQFSSVSRSDIAEALDNNATRKWYHNELAKIPSRLDKSRPLREQGLQAFKLRNEIKMQARELMADQKLAATLKPAETLKNKATSAYKSNDIGDKFWLGMIGSSQRTNAAVDESLGMKNTFAPARNKQ